MECSVDYYCDKMWIYILQLESKKRVRTLFLLQPFRGNPGYDEVTDLPFSTSCLSNLTSNDSKINIKSITKCRMETMYNSTCINERYGKHILHYYIHATLYCPMSGKYILNIYLGIYLGYQPDTFHTIMYSISISSRLFQDQQRADPRPQSGVQGRHVQLYPHQEGRGRHHPLRRGPHVDLLPVHDQRGPPEDPHCDAHHHLQEDIRQHGHPVEVSLVTLTV